MASIKLILRNDKVGKDGEAPLYLRLIKDRKTKFISLGVRLVPNEWDEDKQRVKKNHSNSARINALLAQKVAEAEGQVADLERKITAISKEAEGSHQRKRCNQLFLNTAMQDAKNRKQHYHLPLIGITPSTSVSLKNLWVHQKSILKTSM